MTDQFVAEIRMFAGNFAPSGWAFCDGQVMPIAQNVALFSLLGTTYGGDGQTNFALPNLQATVPIQQGQGPGLTNRIVGEVGGAQNVTLTQAQGVLHTHTALASPNVATTNDPAGAYLSQAQSPIYSGVPGSPLDMGPLALGVTGSSMPHNNLQPYLVVTFIIALQGIFPPRN